jgi:hypothetical protein
MLHDNTDNAGWMDGEGARDRPSAAPHQAPCPSQAEQSGPLQAGPHGRLTRPPSRAPRPHACATSHTFGRPGPSAWDAPSPPATIYLPLASWRPRSVPPASDSGPCPHPHWHARKSADGCQSPANGEPHASQTCPLSFLVGTSAVHFRTESIPVPTLSSRWREHKQWVKWTRAQRKPEGYEAEKARYEAEKVVPFWLLPAGCKMVGSPHKLPKAQPHPRLTTWAPPNRLPSQVHNMIPPSTPTPPPTP